MKARKASDARIAKVFRQLKGNIAAVARRIGYTYTGTKRAVKRLGIKK